MIWNVISGMFRAQPWRVGVRGSEWNANEGVDVRFVESSSYESAGCLLYFRALPAVMKFIRSKLGLSLVALLLLVLGSAIYFWWSAAPSVTPASTVSPGERQVN